MLNSHPYFTKRFHIEQRDEERSALAENFIQNQENLKKGKSLEKAMRCII